MSTGPAVTFSPVLTEAGNALAATPSGLLAAWPYALGLGFIHYLGIMLEEALPTGKTLFAQRAWHSLGTGITDATKYIYFSKGYGQSSQ